jgi:hypothetical protein
MADNLQTHKVCAVCHVSKPITDYYARKNRNNNPIGNCKKCVSIYRSLRRIHKPKRATIVRLIKKCSSCKIEKPISEFGILKRSLDEHHSWCKECVKYRGIEYTKVYTKRHPERVKQSQKMSGHKRKYDEAAKEWHGAYRKKYQEKNRELMRSKRMFKRYGITQVEYDRLLKIQNHKCAICGKAKNGSRPHFDIDHNHESGRVRGLLCGSCNRGLGLIGDAIDRLLNTINYLKYPPAEKLTDE